MVNKWWTIHETLGNMVETAKHTQETLEFDELSKLFLKSRNNIPTYPNKGHFPTLPQHPAARYAGAYALSKVMMRSWNWLERAHWDLWCSALPVPCVGLQTPSGWWFGTFFIFPYIGNNNPNWRTPSFFRGFVLPPTSHGLCMSVELNIWYSL